MARPFGRRSDAAANGRGVRRSRRRQPGMPGALDLRENRLGDVGVFTGGATRYSFIA
jgi:hypothetical protein